MRQVTPTWGVLVLALLLEGAASAGERDVARAPPATDVVVPTVKTTDAAPVELLPPAPDDADECRARGELQGMADFLAAQDDLTVSVRASYDVMQANGEKLEFGEVRDTSLQRPDKLAVHTVDTQGLRHDLVYDGRTLSLSDPKEGVYTTVPAPCTLDQALDHFTGDLGMRFPLKELLAERLPQEIQGLVTSATYVGTAYLGGKAYDQIAARGTDADYQVWIPQEGDPLPARIVITYRDEPGSPQFRATFRDWNLAPTFTAKTFRFTPPAGAEEVAVIVPPESGEGVAAIVPPVRGEP